jgi:hypothetical protein
LLAGLPATSRLSVTIWKKFMFKVISQPQFVEVNGGKWKLTAATSLWTWRGEISN